MPNKDAKDAEYFHCKRCWIDNGNGRGFCQFSNCDCHNPPHIPDPELAALRLVQVVSEPFDSILKLLTALQYKAAKHDLTGGVDTANEIMQLIATRHNALIDKVLGLIGEAYNKARKECENDMVTSKGADVMDDQLRDSVAGVKHD